MTHTPAIAETHTVAAPRGLRIVLQERTSAAHGALDEIMSAFQLHDPTDYRAFLQVHGAVLPALEYCLEAAGIEKDLPDWQRRRRRHALAADLADLDAPAAAAAIEGSLPDLSDAAARMGAAYVLEGSRLGARMLLKRVPADPRFPTRFLSHGGTERLWPRFVERLDQAHERGAARSVAVSAARRIFDLYQRAAAARDSTEGITTVS